MLYEYFTSVLAGVAPAPFIDLSVIVCKAAVVAFAAFRALHAALWKRSRTMMGPGRGVAVSIGGRVAIQGDDGLVMNEPLLAGADEQNAAL